MPIKLNERSSRITSGDRRAPNRAMLSAVGFADNDFEKPIIGVASLWSDITPCNSHIDKLAIEARRGIEAAGGKPQTFGTITVSDGISMGTEGMKYSLVSREVIADSIEVVSNAQGFDGLVAIGGCDKNMPGCVMAMCRLNIPSVFVYGGTIMPGHYKGKDIDIVSIFEAVGQYSAGKISKEDLHGVECSACPGAGSCGGMYTANTMATAIEALGMSLPGSASHPAVNYKNEISQQKKQDINNSVKALFNLIKNNIHALDIVTKKSFENAITVVLALGGSTNAVLHLLALAREAKIDLKIDDFNKIAKKVPLIGNFSPFGKYMMAHLNQIGGIPMVMRMLLDANLIHGDCLTVTEKTVAENLKDAPDRPKNQNIIYSLEKP